MSKSVQSMTWTIAILVLAALGAGCKKDEGKGGGGSAGGESAKAGGGGEDKKPAPAAAWGVKPLDKLPLTAEVPAGAEIMDMSADAPNVMISAEACTVNVSTVTEAYASDFDKAKAEVQKDPNPFKKFSKEEKTEGGWHLEFELESMMDKTPLYGVQIRTTIDGKQYECGRNERDAAKIACVVKVCQSLKKP